MPTGLLTRNFELVQFYSDKYINTKISDFSSLKFRVDHPGGILYNFLKLIFRGRAYNHVFFLKKFAKFFQK